MASLFQAAFELQAVKSELEAVARVAFNAPVAALAAAPGAAVSCAPAVAHEVMDDEELSRDKNDKRDTNNELHSRVCSSVLRT